MNTAKIIGITKPHGIWMDHLKADDLVAYVARVSNPSNQNNHETAPKLLRYLAKHKHWSPFEMVNIVMEIETTRDIARQILRHRSFSFQEFSQRYADPTKDLGFELREARLQDMKNRQNSIETDDKNLQEVWDEWQDAVLDEARIAYTWAVQNGIAKEQARAVLPEGLTVSRMYMNGTLRSWIHYCQLRMGPETQKEHREVAQSAWEQIAKEFPSLSEVVTNN
jgi:thymidylate synthase (FAD)